MTMKILGTSERPLSETVDENMGKKKRYFFLFLTGLGCLRPGLPRPRDPAPNIRRPFDGSSLRLWLLPTRNDGLPRLPAGPCARVRETDPRSHIRLAVPTPGARLDITTWITRVNVHGRRAHMFATFPRRFPVSRTMARNHVHGMYLYRRRTLAHGYKVSSVGCVLLISLSLLLLLYRVRVSPRFVNNNNTKRVRGVLCVTRSAHLSYTKFFVWSPRKLPTHTMQLGFSPDSSIGCTLRCCCCAYSTVFRRIKSKCLPNYLIIRPFLWWFCFFAETSWFFTTIVLMILFAYKSADRCSSTIFLDTFRVTVFVHYIYSSNYAN
jgi:hypothetical protein